MESNKVGFWLQLVASVGLLVGIALVGIQINQSNVIARANAGSVYFQQYQDYLIAGMGENPAVSRTKAVLEPENLTAEDIQVLIAETQWRISMMEHMTLMEELGILDDQWHAEIPEYAFFIGSTPVAREFFLEYCDTSQWAVSELCTLVAEQPKGRATSFVEKYLRVAETYARSKD